MGATSVRHRDAHIFGLPAGVAAEHVRIAKQARRGIAELLCRHRRIAVRALAAGVIAQLALTAFAAIDVEGHDDLVPLAKFIEALTNFDDLTHEFVPENVSGLHSWHHAVHEMKIGATNGARGHLDDDVSRIFRFSDQGRSRTEYRSFRSNTGLSLKSPRKTPRRR
jgi:hypothetical protein